MKKFLLCVFTAMCLAFTAGCEDPGPDDEVITCYTGVIADIFTEGGGEDRAEVLTVKTDDEPVYFTLIENTRYLVADAQTGKTAEINRADLSVGDRVEINFKSDESSSRKEAVSVKVVTGTAVAYTHLNEPPGLKIILKNGEFEALAGGYSWIYENDRGESVAVIADSAHPLQLKKHLVPIVIEATPDSSEDPLLARLRFDIAPDSVTVCCWSDIYWDNTDAESKALQVQAVEADFTDGGYAVDNKVRLKSGNYIYEVQAVWEDRGTYSGRASYCFYVTAQK